jgi:CobQ-like glutamine amidotransferase family enzyme
MSFDQVGFFGQYYFKGIKAIQGLGILAYYSEIIDGRNMGKFQSMGAGVTYQFKL